MNHMRMLILLVVFAGWGCCVLCSDLPWTQGRNATVSVWSASRHTLSFEGGTWMTSSPTFVNCNATRFVDGELLVQSPTPALSNGTNPSLGPWTQIRFDLRVASAAAGMQWAPAVPVNSTVFQVSVRYYSVWDVFEWRQQLPFGCSRFLNVSALPNDDDVDPFTQSPNTLGTSRAVGSIQYQSATFTSSGFPSYNASAGTHLRSNSLGFALWRGTWSWSGFTIGAGLRNWQGGSESGPTVLFQQQQGASPSSVNNAGNGTNSVVLSPVPAPIDALVISAADDFFTATIGKATCRQLEPRDHSESESSGLPCAQGSNSESHALAKGIDSDDVSGRMKKQRRQERVVLGSSRIETSACSLENNTDYWGHDIKALKANSTDACCVACQRDQLCTGFTYLGNEIPDPGFRNHCYLKASREGRRFVSGHVSGYLCSGDDEQITMGVQGYQQAVPMGASFSFVTAPLAGRGIQAAVYEWGAFLQAKHETKKLAEDITTTLGFGTDNGAWISDHQFPFVNATLIVEAFRRLGEQGVGNIRYLAFDPWWYRGQPGWVTSAETFPQGLPAFAREVASAYSAGLHGHALEQLLGEMGDQHVPDSAKSIGEHVLTHKSSTSTPAHDTPSRSRTSGLDGTMFPLLLYSSYWGVNESIRYPPYREKGFKFYTSRKYVHSDPQHPYAARFDQSDGVTSSAFYDYIYGIYADEQKVMAAAETDFLNYYPLIVNEFAANSTLLELWVQAQDDALSRRGIPWQQCMALPSYTLDSLKRSSLTNARGTVDATPLIPDHWILPWTSLFFDAVAIRPFFDNIWTTGRQPGNWYNGSRPNVRLEAAIAVLSRGPIWIGDAPGLTNATIVNSLARADGLLLAPTRSMTPIDRMFLQQMNASLNHRQGMVLESQSQLSLWSSSSSQSFTSLPQHAHHGEKRPSEVTIPATEALGDYGDGDPPGQQQIWASSTDLPCDDGIAATSTAAAAAVPAATTTTQVRSNVPPWRRGFLGTSSGAAGAAVATVPVEQLRAAPRDAVPQPGVARSYSLLAVDLGGTVSLHPEVDLWPPSRSDQLFVAAPQRDAPCHPGTSAAECGAVVIGGAAHVPLVIATGPGNSTAGTHSHELWTVAPVLSNGWVLLGEHGKVLRLAPQRMVSYGPASSDSESSERSEPGGSGVVFEVAGAVGEQVSMDCVEVVASVHEEAQVLGIWIRSTVTVGATGTVSGVCGSISQATASA